MSQPILFDKFEFERNVCSKNILNIPDDSDIGSFVEVDLKYSIVIEEKTKIFHLLLKIKYVHKINLLRM